MWGLSLAAKAADMNTTIGISAPKFIMLVKAHTKDEADLMNNLFEFLGLGNRLMIATILSVSLPYLYMIVP